jgi:hypothetical protein
MKERSSLHLCAFVSATVTLDRCLEVCFKTASSQYRPSAPILRCLFFSRLVSSCIFSRRTT